MWTFFWYCQVYLSTQQAVRKIITLEGICAMILPSAQQTCQKVFQATWKVWDNQSRNKFFYSFTDYSCQFLGCDGPHEISWVLKGRFKLGHLLQSLRINNKKDQMIGPFLKRNLSLLTDLAVSQRSPQWSLSMSSLISVRAQSTWGPSPDVVMSHSDRCLCSVGT